MDYFELKYDADNYSKAYKQYRKIWVEDHIVIIVVVILALFLIPMGIGRTKKIKYEIDTADIFKNEQDGENQNDKNKYRGKERKGLLFHFASPPFIGQHFLHSP